jgi:hypothetical protein
MAAQPGVRRARQRRRALAFVAVRVSPVCVIRAGEPEILEVLNLEAF